jgi:uncharacterized Zn finger protein (UPF0148 family)
MPVGDDGLWPMRCPEHPEHVFKIEATQSAEAEDSPLFCPYCGYRVDHVWVFAPEQRARLEAAAYAAAEQYVASSLNEMLDKAFRRPLSSSRRSGVSIEFKPGRPPSRRSLPSYEVEETRRTMACQKCGEIFAVYGLAIFCPNCGQLAPAQQLGELLRVHRERLDALDAIPDVAQRSLAEAGVLTANYESTIKDGFSALETYLKARFTAEASRATIAGKGAVFQRLDEAAELYLDHLGVDLPGLVGRDQWRKLVQFAAVRHCLVHNSGIIDDRFLTSLPDWPQQAGQRLHVERSQAVAFIGILERLSQAISAGE